MTTADTAGTVPGLSRETLGRALRDRMSDISEDCYCAGWMSNLEYTLWGILHGADPNYGQSVVSVDDIKAMREMSEALGGWHDGEVVVPLDRWQRRMEAFSAVQVAEHQVYAATNLEDQLAALRVELDARDALRSEWDLQVTSNQGHTAIESVLRRIVKAQAKFLEALAPQLDALRAAHAAQLTAPRAGSEEAA